MWNPNHIWARHMVYRYLGIEGKTIPKNLGGTYLYEGNVLEVETCEAKVQRLYRIFVACACGQRVAFCKMPQHIEGKRHKAFLLTQESESDRLMKEHRKELKEEFLSMTRVPCPVCQASVGKGCQAAPGEKPFIGVDYHIRRADEARIEEMLANISDK